MAGALSHIQGDPWDLSGEETVDPDTSTVSWAPVPGSGPVLFLLRYPAGPELPAGADLPALAMSSPLVLTCLF